MYMYSQLTYMFEKLVESIQLYYWKTVEDEECDPYQRSPRVG